MGSAGQGQESKKLADLNLQTTKTLPEIFFPGMLVVVKHTEKLFVPAAENPDSVQRSPSALSLAMIVLWVALAVSPLDALADWPSFRGPWGNGHVLGPGDTKVVGLPLHWSETNNVKWMIEIPHRGWSTPAVMNGQVWVTTATLEGHEFFVICVDAETGRIMLNKKLFHCDAPESLGNAVNVNCYATPSPVIEPGRVYVHFGSYGTACIDTETFQVVWQRADMPCRHYRGPASSPILFENLLILTFDGVDLQYLIALDKKTGRTVWKTNRSVEWNDIDENSSQMVREGDRRKAHSTPLVITANGRIQMLSGGAKAAYAYDPRTGRELWRVQYQAWSAAPMPVFDEKLGLVFFISGLGKTELLAVRADGEGDVTNTHIVWRSDEAVAKTASPILADGLLYMVTDDGLVTCRESANGKVVWRGGIGGRYAASPILADGRLYFSNQQGKTTVLKAGRVFEVLATNYLSGGFMASPSVSGKALYLRTKTHLARIEDLTR